MTMLILFIKIVNDSTLQFNVDSLNFVRGGGPSVDSLYQEKNLWLHYEVIYSWRVLFRGWDEPTSSTEIERTRKVMIPQFFLNFSRHATMYIWDLMHIDINNKKEDVAKRRMCFFWDEENNFFCQWSGRGQLKTYSSWLTLYIGLSVNVYNINYINFQFACGVNLLFFTIVWMRCQVFQ